MFLNNNKKIIIDNNDYEWEEELKGELMMANNGRKSEILDANKKK